MRQSRVHEVESCRFLVKKDQNHVNLKKILYLCNHKENCQVMDVLNDIYAAIATEGFTARTLQMIDNYTNDIQNGREDFSRFNLSEHAGLCKGGSPLIGASIIACYASASLRASCNAEGRQGQCKSRAEVSSLNLCRDAACARS